MTVLEVGPGMGFFSLQLARLVGHRGHVICVDVQERMIHNLRKRALKAGLLDSIETRICSSESLGISDLLEKVDFALAFAVVHEAGDQQNLFKEIHQALKRGAILLLAEPKGHVKKVEFDATLKIAQRIGFVMASHPNIRRSYSAVLEKLDKI